MSTRVPQHAKALSDGLRQLSDLIATPTMDGRSLLPLHSVPAERVELRYYVVGTDNDECRAKYQQLSSYLQELAHGHYLAFSTTTKADRKGNTHHHSIIEMIGGSVQYEVCWVEWGPQQAPVSNPGVS